MMIGLTAKHQIKRDEAAETTIERVGGHIRQSRIALKCFALNKRLDHCESSSILLAAAFVRLMCACGRLQRARLSCRTRASSRVHNQIELGKSHQGNGFTGSLGLCLKVFTGTEA